MIDMLDALPLMNGPSSRPTIHVPRPAHHLQLCNNPNLLLRIIPFLRQLLQDAASVAQSSPTTPTRNTSSIDDSTVEADSEADGVTTFLAPPAAVFVMSHPRVREVLQRELNRLWRLTATDIPPAADVAGDEGGGLVSTSPPRPHPSPFLPPVPRLLFLSVSSLPPQLRSHVAAVSLLSLVEQEVCREARHFIGTKASSISVLVAQERGPAVVEEEEEVAPSGLRSAEVHGTEHGRLRVGMPNRDEGASDRGSVTILL